MKKIIVFIMMAMAGAGIYAQVQPVETNETMESTPPNTISTEVGVKVDDVMLERVRLFAPTGGMYLYGDKVVIIKDNRAETLKSEVVLMNGAKITPDGRIVFKDGSSTTLRADQAVGMDGSFFNVPPGMDMTK